MADDDLWRRRFQIFMAVRLIGVLTFFLGLAIVYTDLVREGGWPSLGAIIVIVGVIDAVFAPMVLKRAWDQQDNDAR
ncbi:hypothetical protein GCM10023264_10230 [Sphingomonas daechungensis]|uniref:Uncharacterized protein n=1 Tax=Sphingomonas daechungensis TaxID=1176646 RepID=A0ABX6T0E8_9SPHN|nr:hypothetical protein [Sphingomonas daechungensis]QNP43286.1 hypothetical protein H9L15_15520 [Sphingomonas daechungensis]